MTIPTRIFIGAAATVLFAVGGMLTFAPQALYHQSGPALAADVVLSSDLRAGGTLLLLCAGFLAYAALRAIQIRPALQLTALTYLGYGLGRLVSLVMDGPMNSTLVAITAVEWGIGIAALVFARRSSQTSRASVMARPV